jgi:hypothetical protein
MLTVCGEMLSWNGEKLTFNAALRAWISGMLTWNDELTNLQAYGIL